MAEQLIRVCDRQDGEHRGEVKSWEIHPPTGQPVLVDLCQRHSAPLEELVQEGRRKRGPRRRTAPAKQDGHRRGFSVTPMDQIG